MNSVPIIYENDEIYIVNKPAGMPVQGGEKAAHPLDVEFSRQTGKKVFLVHRLDRDTAGLMVVAKSPAAAAKWTALVASKTVSREYTAVCAGVMAPESGIIDEPLVQHGIRKNAVTGYETLRRWSCVCGGTETEFSVLRLVLETGRMHQIRIHLAACGCPIAGDDRHGNFRLNRLLRKEAGLRRMLLISSKLTVPAGKSSLAFEIPLPDYAEEFISAVSSQMADDGAD